MMEHPERFEVDHRFIPPDEVGSYFRRAALVVLPYIEATQSAVLVTAYTFRKPVVATRVGGLPAMVREGETGFLVPPRDAQALAGAVIRLLRDPELRHRLGATAEREARTTYAVAAVAEATRRVYNQVRGDSSPRAGASAAT
jgi:glycosyltransferase involved in cell wall biosynthesis